MQQVRANRTNTAPPTIKDLGDGTYYYNFNVDHRVEYTENGSYDNYDYDQVRLELPVDKKKIQAAVKAAGFTNHKVNINE